MNRFLKLSGEEKREVFQAVSFSMGLRPDIVEKDFGFALCCITYFMTVSIKMHLYSRAVQAFLKRIMLLNVFQRI